MTTNRWQLYSSMPDWGLAEEKLNKALEFALMKLDLRVHTEGTIPAAARKAFIDVNLVLMSPDVAKFGGEDAEPRHYLSGQIETHIKRRYGVHCFVDSYGDVTA